MERQLAGETGRKRISSPEQLHDYMNVTGPGLWVILATVTALLIVLIVFASTVTMENTLDVQVTVERFEADGQTVPSILAILPQNQMDLLEVGMPVRLAGKTGRIEFFYQDTEETGLSVKMDDESAVLPDGIYDAQIVVESTTPISFLLN